MFDRDERMFHRGFGGPRGMGGFRAGRGMVEPAILGVLSEKPMHGYEIISTLEEKTNGMWRPSAGSVYPTLQLLEEKGLIKSTDVDGKKVYNLTDEGRKESETHTDHMHEAWGGRAETMHYFRRVHEDMAKTMIAMRKIARKGSDEQKDALHDAVKAFRVSVESIVKGAK